VLTAAGLGNLSVAAVDTSPSNCATLRTGTLGAWKTSRNLENPIILPKLIVERHIDIGSHNCSLAQRMLRGFASAMVSGRHQTSVSRSISCVSHYAETCDDDDCFYYYKK